MCVTLQLMSQTSGGGKSFKTWKAGLVTSVPSWDRVSFAKCLEDFCAACMSIDDHFHAKVSKLEVQGAESVLDLLLSIRSDALPDLWETAKADFQAKLIESLEIFRPYRGKFLPSPARVGKEFWQKLAEYAMPTVEFQVLMKMSPILKIDDEVVKPLTEQSMYNSVRSLCSEFVNLNLTAEDAGAANDLLLQLCHAADKAMSTLRASNKADDKEILDWCGEYMVGAIFRVIEKGLNSRLDEAVAAIPPQVEKLIQSRNVVAIKNTLFNRQTHLKAGCDCRCCCYCYLHSSTSMCVSVSVNDEQSRAASDL